MYSNAHESNTTEEFAIMVANLNRDSTREEEEEDSPFGAIFP